MAQNAINNIQFTSVNVVRLFGSGSYTPPANLVYAVVELYGAGGGSGGCAATGVGQGAVSGGGGGAGYCLKTYSKADLSPSVAYTIGAGGTAGASGNNAGSAGGNSTFLTLIANGGSGGLGGSAGTGESFIPQTAGGSFTGGDVNQAGTASGTAYRNTGVSAGLLLFSGIGGAAGGPLGQGQPPSWTQSPAAIGQFPGGGARGAASPANVAAVAGQSGGAGAIYITEYLAS